MIWMKNENCQPAGRKEKSGLEFFGDKPEKYKYPRNGLLSLENGEEIFQGQGTFTTTKYDYNIH